jgi:hypothetical protein
VTDKKPEDLDIIKVAGVEVRIPPHFEIARLTADKLPGQILLFGKILASAEEQKILIDAEYRQWRALYSIGLMDRIRKISEWRVRTQLEAQPEFLKFRAGLGLADRHLWTLRAVIDSLRARLDLLAGAPTVQDRSAP